MLAAAVGLLARPATVQAESAPPSWESSYGNGLHMMDDDSQLVDLPFSFTFFGHAYSAAYVNANGNVTFNAPNYDWWHTNIPDDVSPWGDELNNVIIGALYGDWAPGATQLHSDVWVNTTGSAPHRKFVVTWVRVPQYCTADGICMWDPAATPNTFQLQLLEGTNQIQLGYDGLTTTGFNWADEDGDGVVDPMSVGISSGQGAFVRTAEGADVPALDHSNVCYTPAASSYTAVAGPCDVKVVELDVQPTRRVNFFSLNLRNDFIFVIYSTPEFDARDIDPATVRIGDPALGGVAPANYKFRDLNGDGLLDYGARVLGRTLSSANAVGQCTTALEVTGTTRAGLDFVGSDAIIVGNGVPTTTPTPNPACH